MPGALAALPDAPASTLAAPGPAAKDRTNAELIAVERLAALKKLLDGGTITSEEYERKRAEILKDL